MVQILTILWLAHAFKRLIYLITSPFSDYGRESMSRCLPRALSRHLAASTRMVSTRSSTSRQRRNEGVSHIAQRLRELPEVEHEPLSSKLAAVLVPLFEDEDGVVKVWLTQRALHLNSHQGVPAGHALFCIGPLLLAPHLPLLHSKRAVTHFYAPAPKVC